MKFTDLLERVGSTALQTAVAIWLALQERGGGWDAVAFKVIAAAVLLNVAKVLVTSGYSPQGTNSPALDTLKRVAWTAGIAGVAAWLALAQDGSAWNAALVLATVRNAAVASLLKCVVALNIGNKRSAALLPASADPVPAVA